MHYIPDGHRVEKLSDADLRARLSAAALAQEAVAEAPVDVVIAAGSERTERTYGRRAVRYVHIEAGHVGQNIHLQAVALGLGSVSIGAFDDDQVQSLLGLPADHRPLYIIPVGHPRPA